MIAKCLSRYIVGCVLGSLIGLAVLSHDSFIETERALASYLSNIPVVGHGVFDVPPRSPIPPGHNEPPIDHIIGTSMYFRIPTIRVAADQVNVDSRWDIEANTEHGVIVRAHGWSARARDQSSPELRARGLLYCWVQDNDYPNGYIVKHPDLGKFYPSMTDRNGQLIHAEYYTELRRASCAGCYPGIQAADQSKCRLRAMSHYDDQGVRVSVGEHHEWFTTSKPPNMEEHPRITQLRSGVLSTQDHDGNVVEAWTRNYYVYGGCFGGSCLPAGSPGAPWSKSAEDERGGAQVYNSTDYGGSNAWDGCHGDAPGTPCAAGLPDPTTYPGCPNGDSSTWTSTVTVMHQGRQYWCAWSPVASFRVAQYLDFKIEVEGRLSY